MRPGVIYELTYVDGVRFRFKDIVKTSGTKRLSKPLYRFQYLNSDRTFGTHIEDVERAIKFKKWKEVV